MSKTIILVLFAATCLAHWFVPGKMISDRERVLREGKTYKFRTEPIDPSDPFRGKYITLNFEENSVEVPDPKEWEKAGNIYVSLADSGGFARITKASMYEPEGTDYIKATIDWVDSYRPPYRVWIKYPFERFYLEESKANKAEHVSRINRNDSTTVVYAVVNVLDGTAALKDVVINDRSIVDVVREMNEQELNKTDTP